MVGSESSSATNGSSVTSVAGKNRFPANPCAKTGPFAARQTHATRKNTDDEVIAGPPRGIAWERLETAGSPPSQRGQAAWMAHAPTNQAAGTELPSAPGRSA